MISCGRVFSRLPPISCQFQGKTCARYCTITIIVPAGMQLSITCRHHKANTHAHNTEQNKKKHTHTLQPQALQANVIARAKSRRQPQPNGCPHCARNVFAKHCRGVRPRPVAGRCPELDDQPSERVWRCRQLLPIASSPVGTGTVGPAALAVGGV